VAQAEQHEDEVALGDLARVGQVEDETPVAAGELGLQRASQLAHLHQRDRALGAHDADRLDDVVLLGHR
jgi:hypothetical protein